MLCKEHRRQSEIPRKLLPRLNLDLDLDVGGAAARKFFLESPGKFLPHIDPTTSEDFPHCRCKTLQLLII